MGNKSAIEWTNSTWNVITGCDKVSPGCKNCYAERVATRLQKMRVKKYSNGFDLRLHPEVLDYPLKLKESKMIFVNSMSDLFHEKLSFNFIRQIFNIMEKANWHKYQILTKRSKRLKEFSKKYGKFPDNVWIGVSVESSFFKNRIEDLKTVNSKIHFLSLEPLLGSLGNIDLDDIEWVIAGGESGPNFRECKIEWLREIRDQCVIQDVPFFFKQWGGLTPKSGGRTLDSKIWDEFPKETDSKIKISLMNKL
ncbi:MAG TPA: phage Gp37/Gp68 family protein [Nitrososphaeraceae archaeon]|nr:phage Gp37/Gp68 family protein [Nitrososphaeraceae archaeon]